MSRPRSAASSSAIPARTVGLLIAASAIAVGCSQPAPEAASTQAVEETPAVTDIRFAAVGPESGVDFVHNTGAFGEKWLPETMGSGVVVFDYNGDDRPDLLFVNGTRFEGHPGEETTSRLYRNDEAWTFSDVTAEAGLDFSRYCLGGAAGDLDNDGDQDLYLSCLGTDVLLENRDGSFVDVSVEAGLTQEYEFGSSVALLDADNDGWLDIFAARYVTWTPGTDLYCTLDGETKAYCTPESYPGASPRFYRGLGNLRFADVTAQAGLERPDAKALGVTTADFDRDGDQDIAVACDTQPNLLYMNRGDGTFEESGVASGMAFSETGVARGGMGIDAADFDRSGYPSLVIGNFANEMVALFHNEGNLLFVDTAATSDLGRRTLLSLTFGAFFFDFDLDGWSDALIANGHLDPEVEIVQPNVRYRQPLQLFRNQSGRLIEVDDEVAGDLADPVVARGAAYVDLDLDGDLDVLVSTNGGPAKLYRNDGSGHGHWLRIDLEGTSSNRDGVGALVEVSVGSQTLRQMRRVGSSYLSQPESTLTFGLGPATRVDSIRVRWPTGAEQTLEAVDADQTLHLVEPES